MLRMTHRALLISIMILWIPGFKVGLFLLDWALLRAEARGWVFYPVVS